MDDKRGTKVEEETKVVDVETENTSVVEQELLGRKERLEKMAKRSQKTWAVYDETGAVVHIGTGDDLLDVAKEYIETKRGDKSGDFITELEKLMLIGFKITQVVLKLHK